MPAYNINKGVGKEVQFKGFEGVYIYYLAGISLGSFFLFIVLYMCNVGSILSGIIIAAIFIAGTSFLYRLNKKYGIHGMAKKMAKKRRVKHINASTRCFREIKNHSKK